MPSEFPSPETKSSVPRVAFLGWCDRYAENKAGQPIFWHHHLVGVSQNRVSCIYPLPLQGQHLLVGIYEPRAGESFYLEFRERTLGRTVDLSIQIESMELIDPLSGATQTGTDSSAFPGWALRVVGLNKDFMIMEPGKYEVYLKIGSNDHFLGETQFAFATPAPLSPDDTVALKSDPLSVKLVRMELSCKSCKDRLRVYAGLDRNPKLEDEGWQWHRSLGPEFVCSCGKTKFPLVYLREGLSGALVRSTQPLTSNAVDLLRTYEVSALEEACREFAGLLDRSSSEEEVQNFLESHPVFWHSFAPVKLMFKKPILSKYVTDFVILNERKELMLVEIEKPGTPLIKDDGAMRHELQHAMAQANNWLQQLGEHRAAGLDCIGLKMDDVVRVKALVVAGRTPKDPALNRRLRFLEMNDITFLTFDDLLHRTREVIRHIANV